MNTQQAAPQSARPLPPLQQAPVLQATDLTVDYSAGATRQRNAHNVTGTALPNQHALALSHVNFMLAQGESVAVMGPSGSGKSTLLHVLAGILTPTAGHVRFRGVDLTTMNDRDRTTLRRSDFGFVFQSGQLLPELPAVENIALPMMLEGVEYGRATDQAILWLERLGLRQLANQRPGEMSGGQMQRVAIARALSINPSVIFADEPTGALDQTTGHEVMGLLMQASRANGTSVVVVTHDPAVAKFCGTTITMRDGRLQDVRKQTVGATLPRQTAQSGQVPQYSPQRTPQVQQTPQTPQSATPHNPQSPFPPQAQQSPAVAGQPAWPSADLGSFTVAAAQQHGDAR